MVRKKISEVRIVFVTAPPKEAQKLARILLDERLIACANLMAPMRSLYWWDGKMCNSSEVLMVLKTSAAKSKALMKRIKILHSYKVPEILEISTTAACREYEQWVTKYVT